jgi:hypothetical protein
MRLPCCLCSALPAPVLLQVTDIPGVADASMRLQAEWQRKQRRSRLRLRSGPLKGPSGRGTSSNAVLPDTGCVPAWACAHGAAHWGTLAGCMCVSEKRVSTTH